MDRRQFIAAKLAREGLILSDGEIDELLPAYEALLRWQRILEQMLRPESEPALIHRLKTGD